MAICLDDLMVVGGRNHETWHRRKKRARQTWNPGIMKCARNITNSEFINIIVPFVLDVKFSIAMLNQLQDGSVFDTAKCNLNRKDND